jgi:hypothetical protein
MRSSRISNLVVLHLAVVATNVLQSDWAGIASKHMSCGSCEFASRVSVAGCGLSRVEKRGRAAP